MGNLSAKYGNLDVWILGLTPAKKEIRHEWVREIQGKSPDRMCTGWLGVGGGISTKENLLLQSKARVLKLDSVPETTFFIEKAQCVAMLLDKFKSQGYTVHKGIT